MTTVASYTNFFDLVIFYSLAAMIFFPSVTFSVVPAEIFPWALVFVLIYMRKFDYGLLFLIFYLVLSGVYTFVISNGIYIQEIMRSLFAYINPLLSFAFLIRISDASIYRFTKLVKIILFFLLSLGLIQASGAFDFLDPIFKFFIPRSYATSMNEMGGRGATLLASEPARAGVEILFIYLVVRTAFLSKRQAIFTDIFLGLFILLIIKSFIALSLYMIFLFLFYRLKFIFIIIPFAILTIILILYGNSENRFIMLIKTVASLVSFDEIIFYLSNASGHRFISIIASYKYGFYFPFGGGVGNWINSSIEAVKLTNIDYNTLNYFIRFGEDASFRASGYITNLMMDVGIVGTILFLSFYWQRLKIYWNISADSKALNLLFLIYMLFFGSVGDPIMGVTTVICLRCLYINEKFKDVPIAKKENAYI